jgi:hypothetical protein
VKPVFCWPTAEERKQIAKRVEKEFNIPNCPLIHNGTLLHLGIEQECDDVADFHSNKCTYSLTVNFINDDERHITLTNISSNVAEGLMPAHAKDLTSRSK